MENPTGVAAGKPVAYGKSQIRKGFAALQLVCGRPSRPYTLSMSRSCHRLTADRNASPGVSTFTTCLCLQGLVLSQSRLGCAGSDTVSGQTLPAGQHPGTALRRNMQYERGPYISGSEQPSSPLGSKGGATQYETSHKTGALNGSASGVATAGLRTGVEGVDVKQGEVIDRKFYTGREERPQEQVLGKALPLSARIE